MQDTYVILRQTSHQSPARFPFWQPGFLFNEARHVRQQTDQPFVTLSALNQSTCRIDARCTLFQTTDGLISPATAPFGSVEFNPSLPPAVLNELIQTIVTSASSMGARSIQLTHYPYAYAPRQTAHLAYHLVGQGFYVAASATNFHLPVTDQPFGTVISAAERRRLQKSREAGFYVERRVGSDHDVISEFIANTRRRQGYRLSIQPAQLTALLNRFPDEFSVFCVMDESVIAALCVTVRVSASVLYAFLPASNPDYARFSPMVLLIDALYAYCQQQALQLLDLGTALDGNGDPKPSLARFKRNLGAQASPKLTFRKNLCSDRPAFFP